MYTRRDVLVVLSSVYSQICTGLCYRVYTHGDVLVGVAEHGNEHVEQDYDGDEAVGAEHELAHELREVVLLLQLKVFDVHEAVDGKVQRLQYLKQAANRGALVT